MKHYLQAVRPGVPLNVIKDDIGRVRANPAIGPLELLTTQHAWILRELSSAKGIWLRVPPSTKLVGTLYAPGVTNARTELLAELISDEQWTFIRFEIMTVAGLREQPLERIADACDTYGMACVPFVRVRENDLESAVDELMGMPDVEGVRELYR